MSRNVKPEPAFEGGNPAVLLDRQDARHYHGILFESLLALGRAGPRRAGNDRSAGRSGKPSLTRSILV